MRKLKNLTQKDLGEKLEVSSQAIVKYEKDKGLPEAKKLLLLSSILDCSIDYLLKGVTTRPPESNEIVEVLKDSLKAKDETIKAKDVIIKKLEMEIETLREEAVKTKSQGKSKDKNKKDRSGTEKEDDTDRSFKSHAV